MNRQEVFDTMLAHLRKQGRVAVIDGVGCAYRTPEGLKCAVGALIPDNLYNPNIENKSVMSYEVRQCLPFSITESDRSFLSDVQLNMHDRLEGRPDFHTALEDAAAHIALQHGLTYAHPETSL